MASNVEAEPVQAHEPQIPHMPAPPPPYEMPQPIMEEPAAIEHQAEPAPMVERVVEHVPVAPAVVAPAVPVAREPIVLPSDLEQVETDAEKLQVAASKVEPPAPPRPPRVRPPLPPLSNEPLEQVETRK
jgi:ribonuclease E